MKKAELELYTDYLISTFGAATATGMSAMLDDVISHDRVTRFLAEREYTSKDLWLLNSVQNFPGSWGKKR
jgi:hypothetical protein